MDNSIFLSVVIPIRDEEGNLIELHDRLVETCNGLNKPYEIIYVENASKDNSLKILKSLKGARIIVLRWKNYMRKAQSLAMDAGFKSAKGKYIVYMDGDLQVDPEEIPRFIEKLEEGCDVVCGWRKKRIETNKIDLFKPIKIILRAFFTVFRRLLIYEGVHDPGSAIKAFKREAMENIDLYGEMHRYIIALLHWQGYEIAEIEIVHHPRKHGKTKYSIFKGFQGFADLLSIFIWRKYADRPLHFLGVGGMFIFSIGFLGMFSLLIMRVFKLISLGNSIWPVLTAITMILGMQLFVSGIISDSLSRIFYSVGRNKTYQIKEVIENKI